MDKAEPKANSVKGYPHYKEATPSEEFGKVRLCQIAARRAMVRVTRCLSCSVAVQLAGTSTVSRYLQSGPLIERRPQMLNLGQRKDQCHDCNRQNLHRERMELRF